MLFNYILFIMHLVLYYRIYCIFFTLFFANHSSSFHIFPILYTLTITLEYVTNFFTCIENRCCFGELNRRGSFNAVKPMKLDMILKSRFFYYASVFVCYFFFHRCVLVLIKQIMIREQQHVLFEFRLGWNQSLDFLYFNAVNQKHFKLNKIKWIMIVHKIWKNKQDKEKHRIK